MIKPVGFFVNLTLLCLVLAACGEASPAGGINFSPPVSAVSSPPLPASTNPATTLPAAPATATPVPTPTLPPQPTATPRPPDSAALKAQVRPLLVQLWQTYKNRYIQQDGRVKDPQRTDASTSEGQSYALLRAFWMDDRATFDAVLNWSLNNLQLPRGDRLFAYLWGRTGNFEWKVLDRAAATDADQDIAYALLLAAHKWNEPRYSSLALGIINDIWNKTVVTVNGRPYLTAGDWSPGLARPVLNPSYFSPYQYRLFATVDPDRSHNWPELVNTSYEVIRECTRSKLDASSGKLPPNWCALDRQTGAFVSALEQDKAFDSDYGYDAFRTVWRLAYDYRLYNEPRALEYLQSLTVLREDWKARQKLAAVYDHTGKPKIQDEDLGIYAGSGLALFSLVEPGLADQVVAWKLLPRLQDTGRDDPDPAHEDATKARTYYAQNWTWFGLALYAGALPGPDLKQGS